MNDMTRVLVVVAACTAGGVALFWVGTKVLYARLEDYNTFTTAMACWWLACFVIAFTIAVVIS